MAPILKWLARHKSSLQGGAALIAIVAGIAAGKAYLLPALRADLLVRINPPVSSTPPGLMPWLREVVSKAGLVSATLPKQGHDNELEALLRSLQTLLTQHQKEVFYAYFSNDCVKFTVSVENRSERTIFGVRLRVDRLVALATVLAKADLLSQSEQDAFNAQLALLKTANDPVLPELPPMPPHGTLTLDIFAGSAFKPTVTVSVEGATVRLVEVVTVDKGLLPLIFANPLAFLTLVLILGTVPAMKVYDVAQAKLTRRGAASALFEAAVRECRQSEYDGAARLLQEAMAQGFHEKERVTRAKDLQPLRSRPELAELFGPPLSSTGSTAMTPP
jgi:hypothetical protein